MNLRNKKILQIIKDGGVPVLSFEAESLINQIEAYKAKQSHLSGLLAEAMSQSSETWHDNAPAEVLVCESRVLSDFAKRDFDVLNKLVVFEPPDFKDEISLGSVCTIEYLDDKKIINIFIVGISASIPEQIYRMLPKETVAVSIDSPIAKALIGESPGEKIYFRVAENTKHINILKTETYEQI